MIDDDKPTSGDDVPVEGQETLFGSEDAFHRHYVEWEGMPAYDGDDKTATLQILVSFRTPEDRIEFARLIGQPITAFTRALWFPKAEWDETRDLRWRSRPTQKVSPTSAKARRTVRKKVTGADDGTLL